MIHPLGRAVSISILKTTAAAWKLPMPTRIEGAGACARTLQPSSDQAGGQARQHVPRRVPRNPARN